MTLQRHTLDMLEMLPQWMELRKESSNGAQMLDVLGTQIAQIENITQNILLLPFLQVSEQEDNESINLLSIDFIYKLYVPDIVIDIDNTSVEGNNGSFNYVLQSCESIYDFYMVGNDKYYYDSDEKTFYFKIKFESVIINGAEFRDIVSHHVWNPYDEIGLLFGCPRLKDEKNESYRIRLLDVFARPGNSSNKGLVNYLARSLDILSDTIEIHSLSNDSFIDNLIREDNTIKDELKEYIEISNKVNELEANTYWKFLDESKKGLKYIPIVWSLLDTSKWNKEKIQNGIGDTNDLQIEPPVQELNEQQFDYSLYAEGLYYPDKKIYPEHSFKYKVYATGQQHGKGYQPESYRYTVTAAELIRLIFKVTAYKLYEHEYNINFIGTSVDLEDLTDLDKHPNDYVLNNVSIKDGSYSTNQPGKYLQVMANLKTSNPSVTPIINGITVNYVDNTIPKTIRIETQDSVYDDSGEKVIGFESNTWNDTSPLIRVKNDTNDSYNAIVHANDTLTLARGDYQKIYNSEGDWDDGLNNRDSINVRVTSSGTLKLGTLPKEA